MNINITLPYSVLSSLLDANDPERETWSSAAELTREDVQEMVQNILSAWLDTH